MMMLEVKELAAGAGFDWGAWGFAKIPPAQDVDQTVDANAIDLPSTQVTTSDAISLAGQRACEVSVWGAEADAGAVTGDLQVSVLRGDGAGGYEGIGDNPWSVNIDINRGRTQKHTFTVDPSAMGDFKIQLTNNSGQTLAVTIKYRLAR